MFRVSDALGKKDGAHASREPRFDFRYRSRSGISDDKMRNQRVA